MIHLRHKLSKRDFVLDVDIQVPDSGITGVFGESGSGKTTLLRCIAGLEQEGGISAHKRNIGYVFQEPGLFPHLTVRGNIEYGARRAATQRIDRESVVDMLGFLSSKSPIPSMSTTCWRGNRIRCPEANLNASPLLQRCCAHRTSC